jgi:hypothetical protein
MQVPDFRRSFLSFTIDLDRNSPITVSEKPPFSLNTARIQIEACCEIEDTETNQTSQYVLGAACKTEQVGVAEKIWMEPNADFCPILSEEYFLNLKSWDRNDKGVMLYPPSLGPQPERQIGKVTEAYTDTRIDLRLAEGEMLTDARHIVEATLADEPLNGRIEFRALDRYQITLDFPIKTMNASERDQIYQTDTGPLILPDFSVEFEHPIETFYLAFVAFNSPDWAELILQVPTPVAQGLSVNHYSKTIRLDTQNAIIRL